MAEKYLTLCKRKRINEQIAACLKKKRINASIWNFRLLFCVFNKQYKIIKFLYFLIYTKKKNEKETEKCVTRNFAYLLCKRSSVL